MGSRLGLGVGFRSVGFRGSRVSGFRGLGSQGLHVVFPLRGVKLQPGKPPKSFGVRPGIRVLGV